MGFDVARIRGTYQLSHEWTYLNAADGPLVPESVMSAVNTSFRTARTMPAGHATPAGLGSHARNIQPQLEHTAFELSARRAIADLVDAKADCVILGPDVPTLVGALLRALPWRSPDCVLARTLGEPTLSRFAGLNIRYAEPDLGTGELPNWQFNELVSGGTRLVMVPGADPLVGQVTDLPGISDIVRSRSRAWFLADVSDLVAYRPVSLAETGADVLLLDLAPLGGPELAALVLRDTSQFLRLDRDAFAHLRVSPALLGAVPALIEHLSMLDDALSTTNRRNRRPNVVTSLESTSRWLNSLDTYAVDSLLGLGVHVAGISGEAATGDPRQVDRIGRITFTMPGVPATTIYQRLLAHGIVTTLTARQGARSPLVNLMGIEEADGGVTVGLAPYNKHTDIDQLIRAVASLA